MFVVGEVICTYTYISGESEDVPRSRLMVYRTIQLHLFPFLYNIGICI